MCVCEQQLTVSLLDKIFTKRNVCYRVAVVLDLFLSGQLVMEGSIMTRALLMAMPRVSIPSQWALLTRVAGKLTMTSFAPPRWPSPSATTHGHFLVQMTNGQPITKW